MFKIVYGTKDCKFKCSIVEIKMGSPVKEAICFVGLTVTELISSIIMKKNLIQDLEITEKPIHENGRRFSQNLCELVEAIALPNESFEKIKSTLEKYLTSIEIVVA